MTWKDIKAAVEAQGVIEDTEIRFIQIESSKPLFVVCDPNNPVIGACAIVTSDYLTGMRPFPIPIPPEVR